MTVYYGFLSNTYTSALVDPDGTLVWLPFPRFDGDAIFCKLLDDTQGGYFNTVPEQPYEACQTYVPHTHTLETVYQVQDERVTMHDFLPIGTTSFWRVIETSVPLVLTCRPTFGFGYANASYEMTPNGAWFSHPNGREGLHLTIDGAHVKSNERDRWIVGPGRVTIALRYVAHFSRDAALDQDLGDRAEQVERVTNQFWAKPKSPYHGTHAELFDRSLLTIRGLTYRINGALLAAATTSLPEIVGQHRQWDYRFVWVRDGAYGAEALLMTGDTVGCRRFLEFMFNTVDLVNKPFSAPFYQLDGSRIEGERDLLWLSGHQNSRPVRVGNAATDQLQLDIEGDLLWVLYAYWEESQDSTFVRDYWWAVSALADWVGNNWHQPDASLWEFRGDQDFYLHSQLMCWVTMRVGSVLAREVMSLEPVADRWQRQADDIAETIWHRQSLSGLPYFTQGPGHPVMDAALLLMPLYGFVGVHDKVFQATLQQIESTLLVDGTVIRYQQDNMGEVVYPFTLAGFWLARVYLRMGRWDRAEELIERQLGLTTSLGLFAEHVDPATGEPHGNFPQLFPHAGVVTTLSEYQRLKKKGHLWTLTTDG
ncbi:MAG: glycoside hydrolase family 15 protein [Firmicutes bacterium]|nr:glycoside hydrolase family 15 protein [Bacillota bacterium]